MMKQQARHYECKLAIVGTGLAGMAASFFAKRLGINTALVGNTGAIAYTTGYFDLLGVHDGSLLSDPWHGLDALRQSEPKHPLSMVSNDAIRAAFTCFTESISGLGIGYSAPGMQNQFALTPAGISKPTLCLPNTMLAGIQARKAHAKTRIIDFRGVQGFSAAEIVANQKHEWPELSAAQVNFPESRPEARVFPEVIARMLEVPKHRQELAELLTKVRGDAEVIGLPAILGVHAPDKVHAQLQELVGVPLFEIPTMPPGVPGIRLREMCQQNFPEQGVTLIPQQKVQRMELSTQGAALHLKDSYGDVRIDTQYTLLATGRFLSGGLKADRSGIYESLLDLPIAQPDHRDHWYRQEYFDARGHLINRAGVQTDNQFRPLDKGGEPVNKRLFAAGAVLAHQDWVRQRCGAGVAIASAWQAVHSIAAAMQNKTATTEPAQRFDKS